MKINFISLRKWNKFKPIFLENDGPQIQGRSGGGLGQIVHNAGGGLGQMAANVINFKKQILGTIIG